MAQPRQLVPFFLSVLGGVINPRLSLGLEASRQGVAHVHTAGVHGPPEEVGHMCPA